MKVVNKNHWKSIDINYSIENKIDRWGDKPVKRIEKSPMSLMKQNKTEKEKEWKTTRCAQLRSVIGVLIWKKKRRINH